MRNLAIRCCYLSLILFALPVISRTQASSAGQKEEVPSFVTAGFQAYKEKGPEEAVRVWIKDSPIDGSKDALSQANNLRQIQDFYGTFRGYDLMDVKDLTGRIRVIYIAMNYEKGPLFARFLAFRTEEHEWVLTNFTFNTKPEMILPDK